MCYCLFSVYIHVKILMQCSKVHTNMPSRFFFHLHLYLSISMYVFLFFLYNYHFLGVLEKNRTLHSYVHVHFVLKIHVTMYTLNTEDRRARGRESKNIPWDFFCFVSIFVHLYVILYLFINVYSGSTLSSVYTIYTYAGRE